jgi:UDP-N-acetyl-2-amino-2-deoxyglucuronate dehydrogenase
MAIKFVVVGTGWVAGEYLKAIHNHPQAEVYGVVTRDSERARDRLAELNIDTRIFDSFELAVRDPQVDTVVLCSMPDVRAEQTILAAKHGKHIVIEKPLTMENQSLMAVAEALKANPVTTVASFVLRWNPTFDTIKSLINDDALGRVFMAQIDYWHHIGPHYGQYRWSSKKALGGSSMLSAGCHAVDAVRYFAGDVTEVTAYSCATWSDSEYEFDPNAIAIMKLASGGIAKVSSSLECKTPYRFNIHLLGEKGSVMNNQLFTHKYPGQTDYATIPTILPDSGDVTHHPFVQEINDFMDAVHHQRKTRCDFFDAYKSMELTFAIDESIATGKPVTIPLTRA